MARDPGYDPLFEPLQSGLHREHEPTIQARFHAGVEWVTQLGRAGFTPGVVHSECVYGGKPLQLAAEQSVPISARVARDRLWQPLDSAVANRAVGR